MNNFEFVTKDIDTLGNFLGSMAEGFDVCFYCPLDAFCNIKYENCTESFKSWLKEGANEN